MDGLEELSATNEEKSHLLLLPYPQQKGDFALKLMRKRLKTLLPNSFNTKIEFKGKKLNSCFKIKGSQLFIMENVLLIIVTMIMDHNGRGINSHFLKHHIEKEHQRLQNKDFVFISSGIIQ